MPNKPHPLGNEYQSNEDGYEGNQVMYRIKIQEGKYHLKDANGKWAFSLWFEGENTNTGKKYTKTTRLMCEMILPLHETREIVSMYSGFCVTVVIIHLHTHSVYGKLLTKNRKY